MRTVTGVKWMSGAAVAAVLAGACFDPQLPAVACGTGMECPVGLVCIAGSCQSPLVADASADGSAARDAFVDGAINTADWSLPYDCDSSTVSLFHFDDGASDQDACGGVDFPPGTGFVSDIGPTPAFGSAVGRATANVPTVLGDIQSVSEATVEFWVKVPAGAEGDLARVTTPAQQSLRIELISSADSAVLEVTMPSIDLTVLMTAQLTLATFHHVAVSYDGNLRVRVDGVPDGESTVQPGATFALGDLVLLEVQGDVVIDEVRVSSVAR